MNVQRILDEKIKNYTQNNGQKLIEQTLWNNSTVVYTIEDKQNMEMSLIAIDLEKETAKVLVDFLGNLTPMEIELVQLEKADL